MQRIETGFKRVAVAGAQKAARVIDKFTRALLAEFARPGIPGVSDAEARAVVEYLRNTKDKGSAAETDSDQASGANGDAS